MLILNPQKLLECFRDIKSVKVHRAALWILGEYATEVNDVEAVLKEINNALGEGPLLESEQRLTAGDTEEAPKPAPVQNVPSNLVTSDGTYATQSAFNTAQ